MTRSRFSERCRKKRSSSRRYRSLLRTRSYSLPVAMRVTMRAACVCVVSLCALIGAGSAPIEYRFTFPEPQHRWMQVEATFRDISGQTLELRMSRSSPGRYALHDFAKNVYDVHAFDGTGREIPIARPDPYG